MSSNGDTVPVPTTGPATTPPAGAPAEPPAETPAQSEAAHPTQPVTTPPAAPPAQPVTPRRRWLSILSAIMIVLGCVLVPVTATSFWVRGTITDTESYVAVVGPLASDPQVQTAVEEQLTARVMTELTQLDVIGALTEALVAQGISPELASSLSLLQSPLQDRTEALVRRVVDRIVTSERFAAVWTNANRIAHTQLIRLLEGDTTVLTQQEDGQLVVDLSALSSTIRTALENAGVPGASLLPDVAGAVVVGDGTRLTQAETAYRLVKGLPWVLLVVTIALIVIGVLLARRRWRASMLTLGGVLVAALVTIVAARVGADYAISGLEPANRGAAGSIVEAVTDRLRQILRVIGWLALAALVVTALTGGGPRATALRRSVGDTASQTWSAAVAWRHTPLVAGAVALVCVVVMLAADLPVGVSIALVAVVVIAGTLAWRSTRPSEVTG
ncbi:hypothetical protein [Humibacillus xanthopallidus]|uniref:hypothetical protein n=1 Tax=Humibacillus xanthopallidus TaxID=412689 RepID=UPI00384BC170